MQLTHNLFIQLFIPTKKPTSRVLLQVVGYQLWAQLGFLRLATLAQDILLARHVNKAKKPRKAAFCALWAHLGSNRTEGKGMILGIIPPRCQTVAVASRPARSGKGSH